MPRPRHFSQLLSLGPQRSTLATFIQFGFTSSSEKVETEVDGRHGSLARDA
jgi:hypothetical protein